MSTRTRIKYRNYLYGLLDVWPSNSGMYSTYDKIEERIDVYDNSLLVSVLMMLEGCPQKDPPPMTIENVISFLNIEIESVISDPQLKLLPAAYGIIGDRLLVTDAVQDVGNNAWACLALTRFALTYPTHALSSRCISNVTYITDVFLDDMACPIGIKRRWPVTDIGAGHDTVSTEHQINLVALSTMMTAAGISRALELLAKTRPFVSSMFVNSGSDRYYSIGTVGGCSAVINSGSGFPADTTSWNVLANADNSQQRLLEAMKWVYLHVYVTNDGGPGSAFGINKNGRAANTSQYENTSSFLLALSVFERRYNVDPIASWDSATASNVIKTITFLEDKIDNNLPIFGAYEASLDVGNFYPGCGAIDGACSTIGNGWVYPIKQHLASTVYTVCALMSRNGFVDSNPYEFIQSKTCETNAIEDVPLEAASSTSSNITIILISVLVPLFIIIIIAGVVVHKKTKRRRRLTP